VFSRQLKRRQFYMKKSGRSGTLFVPDIRSLNIAQYVFLCYHFISLSTTICRATIKLLPDRLGVGTQEVASMQRSGIEENRSRKALDIEATLLESFIHAISRR